MFFDEIILAFHVPGPGEELVTEICHPRFVAQFIKKINCYTID